MLTLLTRFTLLVALCAAAPLASFAGDDVPSREDLTYGSVSATITSLDVPSRSAVLRFEDGREEAFVIGDQVKDLTKLKVGDMVMAGYARSLGLELRPATEAEMANPMDVTEVMDEGEMPAGVRSVGRTIRAVTTIEELSRIDMTATLKGPLGNYLTIDVENPELMTQVHIGDTVVATFTEAVVLTLEKAE